MKINKIEIYLKLSIFFLLIANISCVSKPEFNKVVDERVLLTRKVDSLQNILEKLEVVTDLNNRNFNVKVGQQYKVESIAILKNGLKLDSVFINNGDNVISDSILKIEDGFFGPVIEFTPSKKGLYNIEVFVSSFAWGNRRVKTQWNLFVDE